MTVICKVLSPNTATGKWKRGGKEWLPDLTRSLRPKEDERCERREKPRQSLLQDCRGAGSLTWKRQAPQQFTGRLQSAKRCQSVRVQNALSTRCLLCQKMMSSPVTASAISGCWCMEHIHITSRDSLFSPPWVTHKTLQWQHKPGQVKHMPCWSGRKAPVTLLCSSWTSKQAEQPSHCFLQLSLRTNSA